MYLCDSEDLVLIHQHTVIAETACQTARQPACARALYDATPSETQLINNIG